MESRGERLRRAFVARGVHKQMSLAVQLGVDESAISRWQRNQGLSLEHAAALCEALDISLDWLVLGRGYMDLHRCPDSSRAHGEAAAKIASLPASILAAIDTLALAISQELSSRSGEVE